MFLMCRYNRISKVLKRQKLEVTNVSNQLAGNLGNARIQSVNGMVLNLYKSRNDSPRKTSLFNVRNCLPKSWEHISRGVLPCVSFTGVL